MNAKHANPDAQPDDPPTLTDERRTVEGPIYVIDVQDDEGIQRHPVGGGRFLVGSGGKAAIRLRDELVSRSHCELRADETGLELVDLGSKNGSYLGGARVQSARLAVGSVVVLGESTLSVRLLDPDDDGEAEANVVPLPGFAGGSLAMRRVAMQVRQLAKLQAAVLVRGETGTGKELVAHALHDLGPRADHPFVPLNVTSMPRDLVDSELFGHERGAFTGAVQRRAGAFAEAEGGTLFLDEIGELPHDAQPKLLRALDGYEIRRVGALGGGTVHGARVVAATHVDLDERVEAGLFRRDLFHRLEVCVVHLPALRDRSEDIPALAKMMLKRMQPELGARRLTAAGIARLMSHAWPGNARELRNVLYRAALRVPDGGPLDAAPIERALRSTTAAQPTLRMTPKLAKTFLREYSGNLSAAARAAGMARTSFRKHLKSG